MGCGELSVLGGSVTVMVSEPVYVLTVSVMKVEGVIEIVSGVVPDNGVTSNQVPSLETVQVIGSPVPMFRGVRVIFSG